MEKPIEEQGIFHLLDHTQLNVTATIDDIKKLCEEAVKYGAATVCVPPCYVSAASQFIGKAKVKICTVVGYPTGYATTDTKLFECKNALKNGADEIEVYANIGYIKKRRYDEMQAELAAIRKISKKNILKLIIDTAILNPDEQIAVCTIATSSQVDFIAIDSKSDFNGLLESLKRLKDGIGERAKIKITGDIETLAEAQKLIDAGAVRIGETKILSQLYEPADIPVKAIAGELQDSVEKLEIIDDEKIDHEEIFEDVSECAVEAESDNGIDINEPDAEDIAVPASEDVPDIEDDK